MKTLIMTRFAAYLILSTVVLFNGTSFAQLSDKNGVAYTTRIAIKFNTKAFDTSNIQRQLELGDLSPNLQPLNDSLLKYGNLQFRKTFSEAQWGDTVRYNFQGKKVKIPDLSQFYVVTFPKPVEMWKTIFALRKLPAIESADPPTVAVSEMSPNDTYYQAGSQWYLSKIQAASAWDLTTGSSSVVIGIIDDGVNSSQPDLTTKISGGESAYDDGNDNHGTLVAGVAGAATNNGTGIASLGWNVLIRPYDYKNSSDEAQDIVSAVNSGATIINCSFRNVAVDPYDNSKYINYDNSSVSTAIAYAVNNGCVVVASAGNSADPITFDDGVTRDPSQYPPYPCYPASYDGVLAVSATNSSDNFASGFNYGSFVDVSAPGIDILTTNPDGTYSTHSGTSFSAPLVSALAGLIWSKSPTMTASQVDNTILTSSDDLGSSGRDDYFGYGRINATAAVRNLYVPQVYSTIGSALSAAGSGQTVVVSGAQTISSNLTVPSGVTLQINSGATISFSGYYKLRIEGALLASGSSSSPITFQGNGSSGSWFGIEFYNISSGSSLRYCTIKDASYGMNLISSYVPPNPLVISNNDYGVNCTNYSDPSFTSTVFDGNNYDVYGDGTSTPLLGTSTGPGYNSFRNPGYYQVYSTYGGTISAEGNWWGGSPPSPIVTSNVDYSNWLSTDPNSEMKEIDGKHVVVIQAVSPSSSKPQSSGPIVMSSDSGTTQLDAAYRLYLVGDYEDALQAFETVTASYPDDFAACRALVFAERCLDRLGRSSDVLTELNDVSAAHTGTRVNTFAEARRTYQYLERGMYQKALAQAVQTAGSSGDTSLVKFALYDAGSINWYDLGNKGDGEKYYRQLVTRFPRDPLSASALVAMGEATAPSTPQQQADTVTEEKQALLGNYPNPFNPTTVISYSLKTAGHVTLRVYDVVGRVVATLIDGQENAGLHSVQFDGQNLASGVYLYRLTAPGIDQVKKMILMK